MLPNGCRMPERKLKTTNTRTDRKGTLWNSQKWRNALPHVRWNEREVLITERTERIQDFPTCRGVKHLKFWRLSSSIANHIGNLKQKIIINRGSSFKSSKIYLDFYFEEVKAILTQKMQNKINYCNKEEIVCGDENQHTWNSSVHCNKQHNSWPSEENAHTVSNYTTL